MLRFKSLFFLLILSALSFAGCANEAEIETNKIEIEYYYFNICADCDKEADFLANFKDITGMDADPKKFDIHFSNVYYPSQVEPFNERMSELASDLTIADVPIVIVDNIIISASTDKEIISDTSFLEIITNSDKPNIIFFTATGCKECEKVKSLFYEYDVYSNINVMEYIISVENTANTQLSLNYIDQYNVKKKHQITPIIYIGDKYYSSASEIEKHINEILSFEGTTTILTKDKLTTENKNLFIQIGASFLAGLLNGFNPCSLSMTIMLLSVLIANGKNIKSTGLSYITGKFIAFLLLGTLLLNVISMIDRDLLNFIIKVFLIVLASILAVMNLIDAINAKHNKLGKIRLQLPMALRKTNHKLIEKFGSNSNIFISVIIGFVLGIVIAFGEFLCTGQLYIATIAAVSVYSTNTIASIQIILYSLGFVLPLVAVVFISSKGVSSFKLSNFFREKMYIIKIVNTIFFVLIIVLAIFLL